jgi:cobalt-zinc-cadmium efflux system membrane fusion protein
MKYKNTLIFSLAAVAVILLLVAGIRYFRLADNDEHIQDKSQEEHVHYEPETHDDHIHDENEVHDEHDHDESTHDEHEVHDDQAGGEHEEHIDEDIVHLTNGEIKGLGIEVDTAGPGKLQIQISLHGEIRINADQMANVVPRLLGVVREVKKKLGDTVRRGEVMAIIVSRELADVRASFHAALERVELAEANHNREERLWKKKITAEQEYLDAKKALAEARIELVSAEQKLLALGFSTTFLKDLPHDPIETLTEYQIIAPFDGKVIDKDITLGEVLKEDKVAFVVADLSTVWVDLSIYQKDLPYVRKGQRVIISAGLGIPDAEGVISYLGPIVADDTRTALARVVLPNPEGLLRPGLFVTASLVQEEINVHLLIPKSALQNLEGETCVFIHFPEGFKPQPVAVGRTNKAHAEIISGLKVGQRYVTKGAFDLKAKIVTSSLGGHAGHGH